MAVDFGNLTTHDQWTKLENLLKSKSYITGFKATQDDVITYSKITVLPNKSKFPNSFRWFKHISFFDEAELQSWPKGVIKVEAPKKAAADDDDFDVFGEETEADKDAAKQLAEKKKGETKKKEKKPVISKSTLTFEIKPNDIETDLDEVAKEIKKISMDGLDWSKETKKLPIAFGLYKLQIGAVIVDDKIQTEEVLEKIEVIGMNEEQAKEHLRKRDAGEDYDDEEEQPGKVQSVEIVSFQKL